MEQTFEEESVGQMLWKDRRMEKLVLRRADQEIALFSIQHMHPDPAHFDSVQEQIARYQAAGYACLMEGMLDIGTTWDGMTLGQEAIAEYLGTVIGSGPQIASRNGYAHQVDHLLDRPQRAYEDTTFREVVERLDAEGFGVRRWYLGMLRRQTAYLRLQSLMLSRHRVLRFACKLASGALIACGTTNLASLISVLVRFRNERVVTRAEARLRTGIPGVVISFGSGHTADLVERLVNNGWKLGETELIALNRL